MYPKINGKVSLNHDSQIKSQPQNFDQKGPDIGNAKNELKNVNAFALALMHQKAKISKK